MVDHHPLVYREMYTSYKYPRSLVLVCGRLSFKIDILGNESYILCVLYVAEKIPKTTPCSEYKLKKLVNLQLSNYLAGEL